MTKQSWRVSEAELVEGQDQRIDRYLSQRLDLPRNRIQAWIRDGRVRVTGRVARASTLVKSGDRVDCEPPAPMSSELVKSEGELRILVQDESLFILDKPAGLVVHPGAGTGADTLVHRLLHLDPSIATVGSPARPGIVHRLDRDTTGALAIARNDDAYRALSAAFAKRRVVKVYLAITHGALPAEGRWSWPLGRHSKHRTRMAVTPGGRPAVTDYRRLELAPHRRLSLVALRLHTGRTHQIRAHLKAAGYPLVGDPAYGEDRWRALPPGLRATVRDFPRPALHAWYLELPHPTGTGFVSATAPLPPDLVALWRSAASGELDSLTVPKELSAREAPQTASSRAAETARLPRK